MLTDLTQIFKMYNSNELKIVHVFYEIDKLEIKLSQILKKYFIKELKKYQITSKRGWS